MERRYFQENSQLAGAELWHASPHDFNKFSLAFIGTGEGAAAFGHGLYFAESETVAENYCTMFGRKFFYEQFAYGGRAVANLNLEEAFPFLPEAKRGVIYDVLSFLQLKQNDVRAAFDYVRMQYEAMAFGAYGKRLKKARALKKALKEMRGNFSVPSETITFKYKIHHRGQNFFLWDEPIGKSAGQKFVRQLKAEKIKLVRIVDCLGNDSRRINWLKLEAGAFYDALTRCYGTKSAASEFLRRAGFDGLKYRDGFSRTDDATNAASFNYVFFDDSLIEIAEKHRVRIETETCH